MLIYLRIITTVVDLSERDRRFFFKVIVCSSFTIIPAVGHAFNRLSKSDARRVTIIGHTLDFYRVRRRVVAPESNPRAPLPRGRRYPTVDVKFPSFSVVLFRQSCRSSPYGSCRLSFAFGLYFAYSRRVIITAGRRR